MSDPLQNINNNSPSEMDTNESNNFNNKTKDNLADKVIEDTPESVNNACSNKIDSIIDVDCSKISESSENASQLKKSELDLSTEKNNGGGDKIDEDKAVLSHNVNSEKSNGNVEEKRVEIISVKDDTKADLNIGDENNGENFKENPHDDYSVKDVKDADNRDGSEEESDDKLNTVKEFDRESCLKPTSDEPFSINNQKQSELGNQEVESKSKVAKATSETKKKSDETVPVKQSQRSRKRVSRLSDLIDQEFEDQDIKRSKVQQDTMLLIEKGNGTPLGNIPKIKDKLAKTHLDTLIEFSKAIFGARVKRTMCKKQLTAFKGYWFDAESSDYQKKLDFLQTRTKGFVQSLAKFLSVKCTGEKEDVAQDILTFLMNPNFKESKSKRMKKTPAKKAPAKKPGKKRKSESWARTDDEDVQIVNNEIVSPSDEVLKDAVIVYLKGVDLDSTSLKVVRADMDSKFPDDDLSSRKEFINNTVKEYLKNY